MLLFFCKALNQKCTSFVCVHVCFFVGLFRLAPGKALMTQTQKEIM